MTALSIAILTLSYAISWLVAVSFEVAWVILLLRLVETGIGGVDRSSEGV